MYTKADAVREFKEAILPGIRELEARNGFGKRIDKPMRREAWNNYTDQLCKDRRITTHQYNAWTHPAICGG